MSEEEISARKITIRPRASQDIERHADYLEEYATPDLALRFRSAIMDAIEEIALMPGAGAPRETKNSRLIGLRMWVVSEFRNYLIFYLTPKGTIEILRVLHGAQDIRNLLDHEE